MPVSSKTKKKPASTKTHRKVDSALSICPVNGAGWCPYPFSAAQLKKRLKRIQEEKEEQSDKHVVAGKAT